MLIYEYFTTVVDPGHWHCCGTQHYSITPCISFTLCVIIIITVIYYYNDVTVLEILIHVWRHGYKPHTHACASMTSVFGVSHTHRSNISHPIKPRTTWAAYYREISELRTTFITHKIRHVVIYVSCYESVNCWTEPCICTVGMIILVKWVKLNNVQYMGVKVKQCKLIVII